MASSKEVDLLTSRIKKFSSEYKVFFQSGIKNNPELNEEDCIRSLKSKGYLVYK